MNMRKKRLALMTATFILGGFWTYSISANEVQVEETDLEKQVLDQKSVQEVTITQTNDEISAQEKTTEQPVEDTPTSIVSTLNVGDTFKVENLNYYLYDVTNNYVGVYAEDKTFSGTATIPSTIEHAGITYTVASIGVPGEMSGTHSFKNCNALRQVVIPSTVTTISNYAFENCTLLNITSLPTSINSVGEYAFSNIGSTKLNLTITNPDIVFKSYVFANCAKLQSVTITGNFKSTGKAMFFNCSSLKKVVITGEIGTLNSWMFRECKSLEEVLLDGNMPTTAIGVDMWVNVPATAKVIIKREKLINIEDREKDTFFKGLKDAGLQVVYGDITTFKTERKDYTLKRGQEVALPVTVESNLDWVDKSIEYVIENNQDTTTIMKESNVLHIGENENGTLTVHATSKWDSNKTVAFTVQVDTNNTPTPNPNPNPDNGNQDTNNPPVPDINVDPDKGNNGDKNNNSDGKVDNGGANSNTDIKNQSTNKNIDNQSNALVNTVDSTTMSNFKCMLGISLLLGIYLIIKKTK